LPVQVSENFLQKIFDIVEEIKDTEIIVDLPAQTISIGSTGDIESFEINNYKKTCLLNGYDDIDFLLSVKEEIEEFEKQL
jgi:3-isopropylmalate/(R)-2-methylmalate dehydratase small subunit